MAKAKYKKYAGNKSRSAPRPQTTAQRPAASPSVAAGSVASAAAKPTATARTAKATPSKAVDFATEYRYVLGDLKLLGILAASMFATLVILALVVR